MKCKSLPPQPRSPSGTAVGAIRRLFELRPSWARPRSVPSVSLWLKLLASRLRPEKEARPSPLAEGVMGGVLSRRPPTPTPPPPPPEELLAVRPGTVPIVGAGLLPTAPAPRAKECVCDICDACVACDAIDETEFERELAGLRIRLEESCACACCCVEMGAGDRRDGCGCANWAMALVKEGVWDGVSSCEEEVAEDVESEA